LIASLLDEGGLGDELGEDGSWEPFNLYGGDAAED
jgi:hypothetical protein